MMSTPAPNSPTTTPPTTSPNSSPDMKFDQEQQQLQLLGKALAQSSTIKSSFKIFPLWSKRMVMILTSAGLQHTIKPDNHIITDTMKSNAVGIIIAGIDDDCALQYVDITDPVELWKPLSSTYNRITETTQ